MRLRDELARSETDRPRVERERARLERENARLKDELEAARRAGARQAAPLSQGLTGRTITVHVGIRRSVASVQPKGRSMARSVIAVGKSQKGRVAASRQHTSLASLPIEIAAPTLFSRQRCQDRDVDNEAEREPRERSSTVTGLLRPVLSVVAGVQRDGIPVSPKSRSRHRCFDHASAVW